MSTLLFCFSYSYDDVKAISDSLLGKTKHRPTIGIVCGSGLGGLVDGLEQQELFPYNSIPGFPLSTGWYIKFCGYTCMLHIIASQFEKLSDWKRRLIAQKQIFLSPESDIIKPKLSVFTKSCLILFHI